MNHVFFSFHFTHDHDRIIRVIEAFSSNPENSCTPFISDDEIERMKREGLESILQWIEQEVSKADALVLLIGEHSFGRFFIDYEMTIARKYNIPIIGIYIDQIPDRMGKVGIRSAGPWTEIQVYDWFVDRGEENLNTWIENTIHRV